MMHLVRQLDIPDAREVAQQAAMMGADPTLWSWTGGSFLPLHLRVEKIAPSSADLLLQKMRSMGGEGMVDRHGLVNGDERRNALLAGTHRQFEHLIVELDRDPVLKSLGQALKETIENSSKSLYSIRCLHRTYPLGKRTLVMGVLNVTPDSFSDGGLYFERDRAVKHGLRMVEEGADFLDIGGESTRPGSKPVPFEEELGRVIPVIEDLVKQVQIPISIDTSKSKVAKEAVNAGAQIINDISGLHVESSLAQVAVEANTPLILMHIRGTPETMQQNVHYHSLFSEILEYLKESIQRAETAGVDPHQIVVDPGIGFGKTVRDNLLIIKHLAEFRVLGKPILLGTSRKSFIGKILDADATERLEGSLSSIAISVLQGAHIIRTHDVLPAKKAIAIADAIRTAEGG